jgi:dTDP-4-amino-4,6-dideoxygalactose transaminase
MDEIRAAIGLVQLEKLPEANVKRGELTARYRANLEGSQVQIPFEVLLEGSVPVYHILPILLPENIDRLLVIEAMKSRGIQSSIHYPPFWSFSAYQGCFNPNDTPIVAEICNRELTLPLYPTMTDDEVNLVCKSLLEALREQL